jgi:hypothetical protein
MAMHHRHTSCRQPLITGGKRNRAGAPCCVDREDQRFMG